MCQMRLSSPVAIQLPLSRVTAGLRVVSVVLFAQCLAIRAEEAHVVIPGYERFRESGLSAINAGRLLVSELNCQSCHGPMTGLSVAPRQAPVLSTVGSRISPDYVRQFLRAPQTLKPGTAMPSLEALRSGPSSSRSIEALVSFLKQDSEFRFAAVGVDAVRRGESLFRSVGCVACHGELTGEPRAADRFAMPLGNLSTKYSVGSLIQFLADPHTVRPSGRMPSLNLQPNEARDIASYLLKDVEAEPNIRYEVFKGSWELLPDFEMLTPVDSGETTDITQAVTSMTENFALRFTGYLQLPQDAEYRFWLSSDDGSRLLIDGAAVIDHDGVHPGNTKEAARTLTAGPHEFVVEYFEFHGEESLSLEIAGGGLTRQPVAGLISLGIVPPVADTEVTPQDESLIPEGRGLFGSLGCAACHQYGSGEDQIRWTGTAPSFATMNTDRGCLSNVVAEHVPHFALGDQQRDDLRVAIIASRDSSLASKTSSASERDAQISQILLTLNCFACHQRGRLGGVPESLNDLFVGHIPEMGDEGRIPPALDGVGDKLTPEWLRTVMKEGAKDRPYMSCRMPRFGADNVGSLVDQLIAADQKPEFAEVRFSEPLHRVTAEGRLMVGDQSLSCIKCHHFGPFEATGIQAMDMTTMTTRLRRDWFHRYLANPQQYRPGTRMPAAWPNGRSVVPLILDGTAATQIEAIWVYLRDGSKAKIPSGLQRQAIELTPVQHPIIYRNFLEGLSSRGIAVGYPEKAHQAFDAEQMTVRMIWHGAFLDASMHWEGRGQGRQVPLGDHVIQLPDGPPLTRLTAPDQPWPSMPARGHEFQFLGYTLNPQQQPAFRYSWNGTTVEDQMLPESTDRDAIFTRTLTFQQDAANSPRKGSAIQFRAGVGTRISERDGAWWVDDAVRLSFSSGVPVVRNIRGSDELLVPVEFDNLGHAQIRYQIVW